MKRFPVAYSYDWDSWKVMMMTAQEIYEYHKNGETAELVIMDGSIIKPYGVNGLPKQVMDELRKSDDKKK
jgi:hypothetical protein